MSVSSLYKCDCCGREKPEPLGWASVGVTAGGAICLSEGVTEGKDNEHGCSYKCAAQLAQKLMKSKFSSSSL